MPVYSYVCHDCGSFDMFRPMSDYQKPAFCPDCGQASERQVTAPSLNLMAGNKRKAHQHNERNAEEPRVYDASNPDERAHYKRGPRVDGSGHVHHHNHSHHHGGLQPTTSRPWQVGH